MAGLALDIPDLDTGAAIEALADDAPAEVSLRDEIERAYTPAATDEGKPIDPRARDELGRFSNAPPAKATQARQEGAAAPAPGQGGPERAARAPGVTSTAPAPPELKPPQS